MRRQHGASGPGISLVPLANILKCVLCVLLLMIAARLVSGALEEEAERQRLERAQESAARGQEVRDEAAGAQGRLRGLEAELERVLRQIEEEQARSALQELLLRRDELKKALAQLGAEAEIARERASREAARAAQPAAIQVQRAEGSACSQQVPFFADCHADHIDLYRDRALWRTVRSVSALESSSDFAQFVKQAGATVGGIVVLLVRPDGVHTHDRARGVARSKHKIAEARLGSLPVPGPGALDLSRFTGPDRGGAP